MLASAVFPEEIALLIRKDPKTGGRRIKRANLNLGKPEDYEISLAEFCRGLPEFEPIETACRLYILKGGK
jgi:hypothetical protein